MHYALFDYEPGVARTMHAVRTSDTKRPFYTNASACDPHRKELESEGAPAPEAEAGAAASDMAPASPLLSAGEATQPVPPVCDELKVRM